MTPALLLGVVVLLLAWFVRDDVREYRTFQAYTEPQQRHARYRVWCLRSFQLCTLLPLGALWILGRSPLHLPDELTGVAARLQATTDLGRGLAIGVSVSIVLGAVVGVIEARREGGVPAPLGDTAALLPRDAIERRWAAVLSFCAGIGEELLFRLLLPVLLCLVHVPAVPAVVIAALLFGLSHLYQGLAGIAATTAVGAIFSLVYLASGQLWIAMAMHVLVDLNALLLRPWIAVRVRKAD